LGGIKTASGQKEFFHYTSYALAAGIPASFFLGGPISTMADLACGVIIPLHAHIGMRSVIVDYVHDNSSREAILLALAAFTVGSIGGLTYFNVADVGLTEGIKALFVKQLA
jgi:succinate dehydrogenase hydrophobic anchor subunit